RAAQKKKKRPKKARKPKKARRARRAARAPRSERVPDSSPAASAPGPPPGTRPRGPAPAARRPRPTGPAARLGGGDQRRAVGQTRGLIQAVVLDARADRALRGL